jgi:DNA-binding response OmpR family regulator
LAVPNAIVASALADACAGSKLRFRHCHESSDLLERAADRRTLAMIVGDGFAAASLPETCQRVRDMRPTRLPLLALSDRTDVCVERAVLQAGADDFVGAASANLHRVLLRFETLMVRARHRDVEHLVSGALEVDLILQQLRVAGEIVRLTPVEFRILVHLLRNSGRTVSKDELQLRAIGSHSTSLYEHMRRLTAKLGRRGGIVRNVRGAGYALYPHDG